MLQKMFDQFKELKEILPSVPAIKQIHRCSGLSEMEETLQAELRDLKTPVLVCEDDGNGFVSIEAKALDSQYLSFYLLVEPESQDSKGRKEALALAKKTGFSLFKQMKKNATDFGTPFYGVDFSRVDYQVLGPIATGLYGYGFSYLMRNENIVIE